MRERLFCVKIIKKQHKICKENSTGTIRQGAADALIKKANDTILSQSTCDKLINHIDGNTKIDIKNILIHSLCGSVSHDLNPKQVYLEKLSDISSNNSFTEIIRHHALNAIAMASKNEVNLSDKIIKNLYTLSSDIKFELIAIITLKNLLAYQKIELDLPFLEKASVKLCDNKVALDIRCAYVDILYQSSEFHKGFNKMILTNLKNCLISNDEFGGELISNDEYLARIMMLISKYCVKNPLEQLNIIDEYTDLLTDEDHSSIKVSKILQLICHLVKEKCDISEFAIKQIEKLMNNKKLMLDASIATYSTKIVTSLIENKHSKINPTNLVETLIYIIYYTFRFFNFIN